MRIGLLYGRPVLEHLALWADDDCGSNRALHLLAVHHFFSVCAVLLHHFAPSVGEQYVRQLKFLGKLFVRFNAVLADTEDHRIRLFELGIQLAEPASFLGSTGRAVLGVEKQHHGFSLELVQRVGFAVVTR